MEEWKVGDKRERIWVMKTDKEIQDQWRDGERKRGGELETDTLQMKMGPRKTGKRQRGLMGSPTNMGREQGKTDGHRMINKEICTHSRTTRKRQKMDEEEKEKRKEAERMAEGEERGAGRE